MCPGCRALWCADPTRGAGKRCGSSCDISPQKGDKNEISAGGVKIKTDKKSGKRKVNVGGIGVGY